MITQGMEIYWRDNFLCPTEEEYRLMISRKTGQKTDYVDEKWPLHVEDMWVRSVI